MSSEPGAPLAKNTRRRVRKACEPCRRRRVKCDGTYPCTICTGYGYSCAYLNGAKPSNVSTPNPANRSKSQPPRLPEKPVDASDVDRPQTRLFVHSDDAQSSRTLDTSFTRADTAIAFPRNLGISLNLTEPPKLHSFAWNTGTRAEAASPPRSKLFEYVALKDIETFSKVYFAIVHPVFGILDRAKFEEQAIRSWTTNVEVDIGFEAVLCGVISLGSLFSTDVFAYESEVAEQGRLALDSTFAHSNVLSSVDFVAGWVLRAIYLRAITRPHLSWMASSMAMHIAECTALHQELTDIKGVQNKIQAISKAETDIRRRTFWVAASLNRLFSCHLGRTRVMLQNVNCEYPVLKPDDMTIEFIELIRLAPFDDNPTLNTTFSYKILTESLEEMAKLEIESPLLQLFRAEISFSLYRKLCYKGITLSPSHIALLLSILRSALSAANLLCNQRQQWWSEIGVPFHSICVLIAINSVESLSLLQEAIATLKNVTTIFVSPNSKEALKTALYVAKGAEENKRKELEAIQRALTLLPDMHTAGQTVDTTEIMGDLFSVEWPADLDLGWSEFLDWTNLGGDARLGGDSTLASQ